MKSTKVWFFLAVMSGGVILRADETFIPLFVLPEPNQTGVYSYVDPEHNSLLTDAILLRLTDYPNNHVMNPSIPYYEVEGVTADGCKMLNGLLFKLLTGQECNQTCGGTCYMIGNRHGGQLSGIINLIAPLVEGRTWSVAPFNCYNIGDFPCGGTDLFFYGLYIHILGGSVGGGNGDGGGGGNGDGGGGELPPASRVRGLHPAMDGGECSIDGQCSLSCPHLCDCHDGICESEEAPVCYGDGYDCHCGDEVCSQGEAYGSSNFCPRDCGYCGDNVCRSPGENYVNCSADCEAPPPSDCIGQHFKLNELTQHSGGTLADQNGITFDDVRMSVRVDSNNIFVQASLNGVRIDLSGSINFKIKGPTFICPDGYIYDNFDTYIYYPEIDLEIRIEPYIEGNVIKLRVNQILINVKTNSHSYEDLINKIVYNVNCNNLFCGILRDKLRDNLNKIGSALERMISGAGKDFYTSINENLKNFAANIINPDRSTNPYFIVRPAVTKGAFDFISDVVKSYLDSNARGMIIDAINRKGLEGNDEIIDCNKPNLEGYEKLLCDYCPPRIDYKGTITRVDIRDTGLNITTDSSGFTPVENGIYSEMNVYGLDISADVNFKIILEGVCNLIHTGALSAGAISNLTAKASARLGFNGNTFGLYLSDAKLNIDDAYLSLLNLSCCFPSAEQCYFDPCKALSYGVNLYATQKLLSDIEPDINAGFRSTLQTLFDKTLFDLNTVLPEGIRNSILLDYYTNPSPPLGLTFKLDTSISPSGTPNPCVPNAGSSGVLRTPSPPLRFGDYIPGKGEPYKIGIGVSDDFLNQLLFILYSSGLFCVDVDPQNSNYPILIGGLPLPELLELLGLLTPEIQSKLEELKEFLQTTLNTSIFLNFIPALEERCCRGYECNPKCTENACNICTPEECSKDETKCTPEECACTNEECACPWEKCMSDSNKKTCDLADLLQAVYNFAPDSPIIISLKPSFSPEIMLGINEIGTECSSNNDCSLENSICINGRCILKDTFWTSIEDVMLDVFVLKDNEYKRLIDFRTTLGAGLKINSLNLMSYDPQATFLNVTMGDVVVKDTKITACYLTPNGMPMVIPDAIPPEWQVSIDPIIETLLQKTAMPLLDTIIESIKPPLTPPNVDPKNPRGDLLGLYITESSVTTEVRSVDNIYDNYLGLYLDFKGNLCLDSNCNMSNMSLFSSSLSPQSLNRNVYVVNMNTKEFLPQLGDFLLTRNDSEYTLEPMDGYSYYSMKVDNGFWSHFSKDITIKGDKLVEGSHIVKLKGKDEYGYERVIGYINVRKDTVPPVVFFDKKEVKAGDIVKIRAVDAQTQRNSIHLSYRWNSGKWINSLDKVIFAPTSPGTYRLEVKARDDVGNEGVYSEDITVKENGGCGCSAEAGNGNGFTFVIFILLGLFILRHPVITKRVITLLSKVSGYSLFMILVLLLIQGCGKQKNSYENNSICVPFAEVCNDGIDNDCDHLVDKDDPNCVTPCSIDDPLCKPCVPTFYNKCDIDDGCGQQRTPIEGYEGCQLTMNVKCGVELDVKCFDGIDNDCDGLIDSLDPSCIYGCDPTYFNECDATDGCGGTRFSNPPYQLCDLWGPGRCRTELPEYCLDEVNGNPVDNDCDGLPNCSDPDCFFICCDPNFYSNECDSTNGCNEFRETYPYNSCPLNEDISCGKEFICDDGIDNDCDTVDPNNPSIDCNDPDCAHNLACCTMNYANDCDGTDSGCGLLRNTEPFNWCNIDDSASDKTCMFETYCHDNYDNDCDNVTDCADIDCQTGTEINCTDGVDDDCDGFIDCADSNCIGKPECCAGSETNCSDGYDNDCDGSIDCFDPDCSSQCCGTNETSCTDGVDNDCDGNTDCVDTECAGNPACCSSDETLCSDTIDNDCDTLVDCDDPTSCCSPNYWNSCDATNGCTTPCLRTRDTSPFNSCDLNSDTSCGNENPLSNCHDNVDNDCDGATDCADLDCQTGTETNCSDTVDDDCDGNIDCADTDCSASCCTPQYYNACDNTDGCGGTRSTDPYNGCDLNSNTYCGTESLCTDGLDNDCDGTVDCADTDCESQCCTPYYYNSCDTTDGCGNIRPTSPYNGCDLTSNTSCGTEDPSTQCHNGIDDDCDGYTDCADTDCQIGTEDLSLNECDNTIDDDCDGVIDCADPTSCCAPYYWNSCDATNGCSAPCAQTRNTSPYNSCDLNSNTTCGTETTIDNVDNDCDGQTDCGDLDLCHTGSCQDPAPDVKANGNDDSLTCNEPCTYQISWVENGTAWGCRLLRNGELVTTDCWDHGNPLPYTDNAGTYTYEFYVWKCSDDNTPYSDSVTVTVNACGYVSNCDNSDGCGNFRDTTPYNSCDLTTPQTCGIDDDCDGIDNDCDGVPDDDAPSSETGLCFNGMDDDCDYLIDCDDPDCVSECPLP